MKRSIHFIVAGIGALPANAQCEMTTTAEVQNECHFVSVAVQTTGGLGPYSISIAVWNGLSEWQEAWYIPNDADGNLVVQPPSWYWELTEQTRVTVTDANGCVAQAVDYYQGVTYRVLGYTGLDPDCISGSNRVKVSWYSAYHPYSAWLYSLDGAPPLSFEQNWLYNSQNSMEAVSTFTVAPGPHTLDFPGYYELNNGSTVWVCPEQVSFVASSILLPGHCGTNFRLRAGLAGPMATGGLMNDGLRASGLIPTSEPYSDLGYSYTDSAAGISMLPSLLSVTGNDAIVDWVVVELRSPNSPYSVVHSRPALIQRDGDVMGLSGEGYINMPVAPGAYRVAIRHRNHLGIMSGPLSFVLDPTSSLVDLRSASTTTYGTGAQVAVGSVQCLWPGDGNGNGTVQYTGADNDRDQVLQAIGGVIPTNTLSNVYDLRDVNMNGNVSYSGANNDRDVVLQTIGGSVLTNTRTQQIP